MAKKVKLYIPKIPGAKAEDVFIRINGKCTQIPRGKTVEVDPAVANEYERSLKAQERYDETAEARMFKDPTNADNQGGANVNPGDVVD